MLIVCKRCHSRFKIADAKIPKNQSVSLKCATCGDRIRVPAPQEMPSRETGTDEPTDRQNHAVREGEADDTNFDGIDEPYDFMAEEGRTALLCASDPATATAIAPILKGLDYHVTQVQNSRQALKNMRYHSYDLIVVDEYFDTTRPDANGVLIYLERLNMAIRRNIFVAMVSRRFRTMDHMTAFRKSVNMVINMDNLPDFDKILQHAIVEYGAFYQVYREAAA